MTGFLEIGRQAFESYKKDIVAAILFGLANLLISPLNLIPIIGAIIGAYIFPRVLGWYYNKTIGNINPNYNLAFKAWLIYLLIINLAVLFAFGSVIFRLFYRANIITAFIAEEIFSLLLGTLVNFLLALLVILVVTLFMYYSLYASILGKINELQINIEKSAILFLYAIGWGIIFFILIGIIGIIPIIGSILNLLLNIFFYGPVINLVIAHKVLSM